jgi:fatty acid desaturase
MSDLKVLKQQSRQQVAIPTVFLFVAVIFLWVLGSSLYIAGVWSAGVAFCVNTLAAYAGFTVLHEAAHGNIRGRGRQSRRWEVFMGWASGAFLTVPFSVFRHLHLTHHAHTNHPEKDPDYWVASGHWWLVLLKSMSIILAYYWHFVHSLSGQPTTREKRYRAQSIAGFTFVYLMTLLGVVIGQGLLVFVLWWGPALLASGLLALGFNWLPHHAHQHQEKYHHTRVFCFSGFKGHALSVLLLAQNYHLIHHLHPGLPFYQYQQVFGLLRPELEQAGSRLIE